MREKRSKLGVALGIIAATCLLGAYVVIAYGIDSLVDFSRTGLPLPSLPASVQTEALSDHPVEGGLPSRL